MFHLFASFAELLLVISYTQFMLLQHNSCGPLAQTQTHAKLTLALCSASCSRKPVFMETHYQCTNPLLLPVSGSRTSELSSLRAPSLPSHLVSGAFQLGAFKHLNGPAHRIALCLYWAATLNWTGQLFSSFQLSISRNFSPLKPQLQSSKRTVRLDANSIRSRDAQTVNWRNLLVELPDSNWLRRTACKLSPTTVPPGEAHN